MFQKILKGIAIFALFIGLLIGGLELWFYKNQEEIFVKVKAAVNEEINGSLEIEDFRFRPFQDGFGFNFTLYNVVLRDSLYNQHKTDLLNAKLIHVALDFASFYKGVIRLQNLVIQDGDATLFVRKDGYTNLSLFGAKKTKSKKKGGKGEQLINKLGRIHLYNFGFHFADSTTGKKFGAVFRDVTNRVSHSDSSWNANINGPIFFEGLTFKPEKGGFLIKQETFANLSLSYNQREKHLFIRPSSQLRVASQDLIDIKGLFDLSEKPAHFNLGFGAREIEVSNALKLLPKKIAGTLDSVGVKTKVDARVNVEGIFSHEPPAVHVTFETDTFQYQLPIGMLRNMKAKGVYTNQGDKTKPPGLLNTQVNVPGVKGLFETLPFNFDLKIDNITDPIAVIRGKVKADSATVSGLLDPKRYVVRSGEAYIQIHYDGSLRNFYNPKTDQFNGKLVGRVLIDGLAVDYVPRAVHISKINGDVFFDEKDFLMPRLNMNDGHNAMYINGGITNLIPYLFGSPRILKASVDMNIPDWKMNWMEVFVGKRTPSQKKSKKKVKLSDLLDNVIDQMEIDARLQSKHMVYHNFSADNMKGSLSVKNNIVALNNFSMNAFGGGVKISGSIHNPYSAEPPRVQIKGNISNADVHSVFYSFNNFGQKAVTHLNLKGKLNTEFNFSTNLKNDATIIPKSMKGEVKLDLERAQVNNFEPFLKMKKLIFKNRNLENVRFAPIRNDLILNGEEIIIKPMEIESNVMTLFLDGVYSFGNKTDMSIEIPFRNLSRRDSTYQLNPNDPKNKKGSRIYLRAVDEKGQVNIKLAFRKKKQDSGEEKDENEEDKKEEKIKN
ncbi:AsmA-like C-terminal region-containing protein [Dyadobacter sp. CY356]|uniref:AsmA-like C-terminal region-containing protein n=1 Tax=Dyadobacter sp. CY356 TaxID=2906442 RepID=UPI001F41268F|nr:AsmA-like C-terminal region-containing protein [Dyadobacter sp. CY356]MCF0056503.1 AsmA-like C-terminal region-containing protein [Dyadobacter sp. CY356]